MKITLTEKRIDQLKAPTATGRQALIWDDKLPGFGVLLSGVSSKKSYVAQRDLPNGRARRVTIGHVEEMTLEKAREEAANAIHALRQGKDPKARADNLTLSEAMDKYIGTKGTKLRPRTVDIYRGSLRYLKPFASLPLRDITPRDVENQHAWIEKEHGPGAANNAMRAFRAVYNAAARSGDLPPNPVRLSDRWFRLEPRTGHVKADDLPKFFQAVCELPNAVQADYLKLLLFTGLRRRSAAYLRWSDVDFAAAVIRLPAESMKSGKPFALPMTDLVRDLLVARGAIGREEFVFPSSRAGKPIQEPKFALALVAEACGVKVSPHDLRRTFATIAERQVGGMALKALLHHTTGGNVTSDYVMLSAKELAEAAQAVADRLRELCQIPRPSGENVKRLA
jgi:integrase